MRPVWDIDRHPDATERSGPGSYREHEIHPFLDGNGRTGWVAPYPSG